ncbi:hypothetical protein DPEC_G00148190 [Dallia pectoralis]|uniref:Uncharacterized protein n=1 Tax=Dallia pectoralis TaxID=75939 RepID=A0ACC2GIS1_DALPE|nr:hypothetical protein DPEC_G00148190 [Dallia pectoralis]
MLNDSNRSRCRVSLMANTGRKVKQTCSRRSRRQTPVRGNDCSITGGRPKQRPVPSGARAQPERRERSSVREELCGGDGRAEGVAEAIRKSPGTHQVH